jgi:integrase
MICMIYRRKRTIDGKIEMARLYRGRYRLDGANKITDVPLHTSDKRIAQQNLEKIVKDKQLETAGMAPSEAQRNAVQSPQTHHLKSYLERHERIEKNPLKRVQKVQTNGRQVRLRRAFTDDEMKRLLKVAGTRKVVYLMAIYTGLRRGELSKLLRTDLHLDAAQPFINVRASTTKNHKQAILALHPDLVPELNSVLASLPARETRLLAHLMPTMITFKADLKAAGIEFINAQGQRADFHSLRHTLATNLARAGTSPRIAMEIMRHSDIKLTTKTYTDAGLLPVSDAVINLPSLLAVKTPSTQIGTQSLFRAGHDLSTSDTELDENELLEVPGIKKLEREDSALVLTGHENEESCRARTRT